ncbi:peroxide stress protein YaaA [Schaalia sp. 19OD2882]|uniref:YaaA family protein n=1 Tax=Schaalia sp. 19OD2882 TaxID=2794089 RepID=UPI001C1E9374|nr:peroxide stress protein YaaA [Schaalia sp. 19OD2882]QWW18785.1 peroxide stress protein YaaA [Schaalia sp. 19OD2882]
MFIWLPPSEGKTAPTSGPALDLDSLSHPRLNPVRAGLIMRLQSLGDKDSAVSVLGLGAKGGAAALAANSALLTSPCAPAAEVYTGVLFEALDLAGLVGPAGELAERQVRIFSGLFGILSPADMVPDHRLPMGARLPGLGTLAAHWKAPLTDALSLEVSGHVILDCRSGPYRAACTAPPSHLVELSVVREADGKRQVVSHDAKKWRGLVTRQLLAAGVDADSPEQLAGALQDLRAQVLTVDAKGIAHRAVSVEVSPVKAHRSGATHRVATLVTT